MPLTVRAASEPDWADLRDLRLQALTETPLAFGSTLARELAFTESDWRGRASRAGQVLAWVDDVLVGTAVGVPEGDIVHLAGMYVDPTQRGQGCADRLIETVIENARLAGAGRVLLWVTEVNLVAERCYTRHGFVRTGRDQPLPHTPGVFGQEMELRLERRRAGFPRPEDLSTRSTSGHGPDEQEP